MQAKSGGCLMHLALPSWLASWQFSLWQKERKDTNLQQDGEAPPPPRTPRKGFWSQWSICSFPASPSQGLLSALQSTGPKREAQVPSHAGGGSVPEASLGCQTPSKVICVLPKPFSFPKTKARAAIWLLKLSL